MSKKHRELSGRKKKISFIRKMKNLIKKNKQKYDIDYPGLEEKLSYLELKYSK
ncbi:hypothetical protein ES705_39087 [subsurface metagenome]